MILRIATTSLFPKLVLVKCGRLVVGKNLLDGEENYFSNKVNQLLEAHLHIKILYIYICVCVLKKMAYIYLIGMCTGLYQKKGTTPEPHTKCVGQCIHDVGDWGKSFCYTNKDQSQWGAECTKCLPGEAN